MHTHMGGGWGWCLSVHLGFQAAGAQHLCQGGCGSRVKPFRPPCLSILATVTWAMELYVAARSRDQRHGARSQPHGNPCPAPAYLFRGDTFGCCEASEQGARFCGPQMQASPDTCFGFDPWEIPPP